MTLQEAPAERTQRLQIGTGLLNLPVIPWNGLVAASVALAASKTLLGRTHPTQATLGWILAFGLFFSLAAIWLTAFSTRLNLHSQGNPRGRQRTVVAIESPLLVLSLAIGLGIYLSDEINHQFTFFLQPAPAVALLLAVVATSVAQEAALRGMAAAKGDSLLTAISTSHPWALSFSLLFFGLLQGSSYLWVIGNDFTRYWAVADAISSWAGYPASIHQALYIQGGMYRYSIELPLYPLLLLASFTALGHNTLAAHTPALLANTALPLLLYAFYRKAGFERPVAYAAACLVAAFPFFRLYTLNTPLPDAVFVALLVAAGYAFLHLISAPGPRHWLPWPSFGLLAGLAALTRPEGLLFVGVMFLALVPNLLRPRFYLAAAAFLATTAPFSLLMMSIFGIPWPRNAGSTFHLRHVAKNLDMLERVSLRWFADPFGLSPSTFAQLVGLLAVAALVGTLWMARRRWQLAALPLATAVHITLVFTINPRVAGADQWFDFFRHISYGLPFVVLPLLFLAKQLLERAGRLGLALKGRPGQRPGVPGDLRLRAAYVLALLVLLFSAYGLRLLAQPSKTYGAGSSQLLTSDVWVSLPDIVAYQYPLPKLPFVHREGILMIDPEFEYIKGHLRNVQAFFDPASSLNTGKGTGYVLSSLLVMLFGAVFVLGDGSTPDVGPRTKGRDPRREASKPMAGQA